MSAQRTFLLLTNDAETEKAVLATQLRLHARIQPCRSQVELVAGLEATAAPLALVDVEPQPLAALATLAGLVGRFPGTRFVVLCKQYTSELVLEAMQIGARHCLVKSAVDAELATVVQRILQPAAAGAGPRTLVTVLSTSGGCGATTVAVNLAEELRLISREAVLVLDLDVHYGAVASYLELRGLYGVADVLGHADAIDAQLVRSTACAHGDDLHALLSPASIDQLRPAALRWERLPELLAACKGAFASTVVDAARVPLDAAVELARQSDLVLVVFELAVVDIRNARMLLAALGERGTAGDVLLPVANRCSRRSDALGLEDARKALGCEVARLGNDFPNASKAINHGQPLARCAPRSPLREELRQLALRCRPSAAAHDARRSA